MEDDEKEGGGLGASILVAAIPALVNWAANAYQNWKNKQNQAEVNAYNSPTEQMARYRAAGLNPNLIYGSGTTSAGNASSLPSYQTVPQSVQDIINAATAVVNLRTMRSQELKNNAEAQEAVQRAEGQALSNQRQSTENYYLDSYLAQRNQEQSAQIALARGQITLQEYQKRVLISQAMKLFEDGLYTRFKRTSYDPELLNVKHQELSNASAMLAQQLTNMATENRNNIIRGGVLAKDYSWYDWRAGFGLGKDVLSGVGSLLGGLGLGKVLGAKALNNNTPWRYPTSYSSYR